jgi:hypothetical protein
MRRPILAAALAVALASSGIQYAFAQSRPLARSAPARAMTLAAPVSWNLNGKWVYRRYLNRPDIMVGSGSDAAATALSLLFGEGIMTLRFTPPNKVTGTFDMGGGYVLDLSGTVVVAGGHTSISMVGPGRAGTPTAGWEYDYNGVLTKRWPKGVDQIPVIVGSVFRAKPHGSSPAGMVASFIAVKKP